MGTIIKSLVNLFKCEPFNSQAWSANEGNPVLRDGSCGRSGKETRWTPRARTAWLYLDRYFQLDPTNRPKREPRPGKTAIAISSASVPLRANLTRPEPLATNWGVHTVALRPLHA